MKIHQQISSSSTTLVLVLGQRNWNGIARFSCQLHSMRYEYGQAIHELKVKNIYKLNNNFN